MYIPTRISNKNCHRHSYGFQNLMSSWGVGILFSKLPFLRVFLINHVKSIGFKMVILGQHFRFSYFLFGLIFEKIWRRSRPKEFGRTVDQATLHSPFGVQRTPYIARRAQRARQRELVFVWLSSRKPPVFSRNKNSLNYKKLPMSQQNR